MLQAHSGDAEATQLLLCYGAAAVCECAWSAIGVRGESGVSASCRYGELAIEVQAQGFCPARAQVGKVFLT